LKTFDEDLEERRKAKMERKSVASDGDEQLDS